MIIISEERTIPFISCLKAKQKSKNQLRKFVIQFGSNYRLPVDWKTPHGYAIAFVVELCGSFYTTYIVVPYLCLAIGSLSIINAFVKDISNDLSMLNVTKGTDENHSKIKERFCDIIQRFSDAKELSENRKPIPFTTKTGEFFSSTEWLRSSIDYILSSSLSYSSGHF